MRNLFAHRPVRCFCTLTMGMAQMVLARCLPRPPHDILHQFSPYSAVGPILSAGYQQFSVLKHEETTYLRIIWPKQIIVQAEYVFSLLIPYGAWRTREKIIYSNLPILCFISFCTHIDLSTIMECNTLRCVSRKNMDSVLNFFMGWA